MHIANIFRRTVALDAVKTTSSA